MKVFNLYMGLILIMDLSDVSQASALSQMTEEETVNLAGLNCDKNANDPMSCMACQIYFESRGESDAGQLAVAKVTLKRANNNSQYVCDKVFEKRKKVCQFSWACEEDQHIMRDVASAKKAVKIARQAFSEGPDRFDHFYATYIPQPNWANKMLCETVGNHVFCDGNDVAGYKKVPGVTASLAISGF